MPSPSPDSGIPKPEISRYMLAMFDVLGFSRWIQTAGLSSVLGHFRIAANKLIVLRGEE